VSYSFRPHRIAAHALATGSVQMIESPSHTNPPSPRRDAAGLQFPLGLGGDPFDSNYSAEPSLVGVGGGNRGGVSGMRQSNVVEPMYAHGVPQQQQQHYYARPRQLQPAPQFVDGGRRGNSNPGPSRAPVTHMPEYDSAY